MWLYKYLISTLLISFASTVFLYSQQTKSVQNTAAKLPEIPSDIELVVSDTYGIPAELAIDILLQVVKSPRISKSKKKEILLNAYQRLDEVQQPLQKKLLLRGLSSDTYQNLRSRAFAQKFDVFSLQSKILRELLRFDKKKAREYVFQYRIEFSFQPVTCEDALDYDVSDFYELVTSVAKESFTPQEIKSGIRLWALDSYVQDIRSASQIRPIGKMLLSLDLTTPELRQLVSSYSLAVKKLTTSDRAFFGAFLDSLGLFDRLITLTDKRNIQSEILTESIRSYIIKHLQSERCSDNSTSADVYTPSMVKWLNQNKLSATPLSVDEISPTRIIGSATLDDFWKTKPSNDLLGKLKKLRFESSNDESGDDILVTQERKQENDWKERFDEMLNEIENWDGLGEQNSAIYFHQKCILFSGLIDIVSDESAKDKVLHSFEKYLSQSPMQKESRMEWFLHVAELIRLVKPDVKKQNSFEYDLLSNSKNPVLRIYADFIRLNI